MPLAHADLAHRAETFQYARALRGGFVKAVTDKENLKETFELAGVVSFQRYAANNMPRTSSLSEEFSPQYFSSDEEHLVPSSR